MEQMKDVDPKDDFTARCRYYKPTSEGSRIAHETIRKQITDTGMVFIETVPNACRERSLALTKLEEAMMWANAAIARHQGSEGGRS